MTFIGEEEQKAPGSEAIIAVAGADIQGAPGDGDQLIGVYNTPGMEKLVLVGEIARG